MSGTKGKFVPVLFRSNQAAKPPKALLLWLCSGLVVNQVRRFPLQSSSAVGRTAVTKIPRCREFAKTRAISGSPRRSPTLLRGYLLGNRRRRGDCSSWSCRRRSRWRGGRSARGEIGAGPARVEAFEHGRDHWRPSCVACCFHGEGRSCLL